MRSSATSCVLQRLQLKAGRRLRLPVQLALMYQIAFDLSIESAQHLLLASLLMLLLLLLLFVTIKRYRCCNRYSRGGAGVVLFRAS